ncbi:hypothetical protein CP336_13915 [Pseudomonas fluorescens]|nr:hypothetical protein CP336_13915 [Pseudomonas fluorescens]
MRAEILKVLLVILLLVTSGSSIASGLIGDVFKASIIGPLSPPEASIFLPPDPAVQKAENEAKIAYYRHYTETLAAIKTEREQARSQIEWQLTTTKLIFAVVVCITLSGVIFCWVQFLRVGVGRTKTAVADLEISAAGIKVTSPVLGVVVLALSLVFFYLYLQFVYPIRVVGEVGGNPIASTQSASKNSFIPLNTSK